MTDVFRTLKWSLSYSSIYSDPEKKSQIGKEPVVYFLPVSELILNADSQAEKV